MYQVFSDESGIFSERYQTIAAVSGEHNVLSELRDDLQAVLYYYGVSEIKFVEVRTHYPKVEAAWLFLENGINYAIRGQIRIDSLVWDTHDKRHSITGRNDVANLNRMYYKLLRHISEQWNQVNWEFYPDENSVIDWNEIIHYLNATQVPRRKPNFLSLFDEERYTISFDKVSPINSQREPLVQLSDLFAGMARFLRYSGSECINWLKAQEQNGQELLFDCAKVEIEDPNKTKCNRFALTGKFNNLCKKYRLGVSLRSKEYLWTPSPHNPINFWNYEPQQEADRAPT